MGVVIPIQNLSTVVTDDELRPMIAAVQRQISEHISPVWCCADAKLVLIPKGTVMPPAGLGSFPLFVMDDSTQAGALGFHEVTNQWPVGYVFAKTDMDAGTLLSVTLSHEAIELAVDPFVFSTVIIDQKSGPLGARGVMLALEIADAPEGDQFAYDIDGVKVSDWCFPGWFGAPGWKEFDFTGHCKQPFEILSGGYIGVRNYRGAGQWGAITAAYLGSADTGWHQLRKDGTPQPLDQIPPLSRRGRRMAQWRNTGPVLATQDLDEDRET